MPGHDLQPILILLTAAVLMVAFFKQLRLTPVLGYLAAGCLIGPFGLGYLKETDTTHAIAELGIVFLLFYIGMELTFERLKSMRKQVFGFGTLQVVCSGLVIGSGAWLLGMSPMASIIIGGGLALSSTAIVLEILNERGEQSTQEGRLALAALILQDLAVVPLLIMIPLFGEEHTDIGGVLLRTFLSAVGVLLGIAVVGRLMLQPLFRSISRFRSPELFTAATLLIVLGASWLTSSIGLSMALGAFVAGLLVAETDYHIQIEADLRPFKGLLLGLFFMTVGMTLDVDFLLSHLFQVLGLALMMMIAKFIIVTLLARAFGFSRAPSLKVGINLCQGSEFAFALFMLAATHGLVPESTTQLVVMVVTVSMILTPLAMMLGNRFPGSKQKWSTERLTRHDIRSEMLDVQNHIMVIGYGRVGKYICELLQSHFEGNFVAVDNQSQYVSAARRKHVPVFYGDADRLAVLNALGLKRARMVVVTIKEKRTAQKIIAQVRRTVPDIPIVVQSKDKQHVADFKKAGATVVVAEALESSILMGDYVLKQSGIPDAQAEQILTAFREQYYLPKND